MNIRKPWEKAYREEVPADLAAKIEKSMSRAIDERTGKKSWLAWFEFPQILVPAGALGAAAIVILLARQSSTSPEPAVSAAVALGEPEMLLQAEMLSELKLLQNLPILEQMEGKPWQKTGS